MHLAAVEVRDGDRAVDARVRGQRDDHQVPFRGERVMA